MALADWFRRLFSPAPGVQGAEDDAILREEYGEEALEEPAPGGVTGGGGISGLAGLEDAEAAEAAAESDQPPPDPAP